MKAEVAALALPTGTENRSLARHVGVNSLWLLLARVVSQGLMLVFTALVARRLGEAGFGQYAFIASVVFIGNMITTFGMDTLLIREIARTRTTATALAPAAFWIQLALSGIFIAAVFIAADQTETAFALRLYALTLIPLALYTIFSAILRAFERMDAFLALNVVTAILQLGAASIAFSRAADLTTLISFLVLSQIVSAVFAAALCFWLIPSMSFRLRVARGELISIGRTALPLAALVAFGVIYQRIGLLMLPALAGDSATGWFSAATRIVEALKLAPQALLGALFPLMSRWAFEKQIVRAPLILSMSFGTVAALGITVIAPALIDLIYGARFAPSAAALQVLVWGLIPYAFTATITLELIAKRRERRVVFGNAIGVGVAAILYVLLTLEFGWIGACWAALASEWTQAALFFALRK